uniref:translation initiation factor IF-2-like n=1 Tax=Oncorhynchus gorbuscha TaxID=8017 RepID=UPI001EAED2EB|nr:translation initiation factor IF-2-like [Oncorhynchus gorbuscha]
MAPVDVVDWSLASSSSSPEVCFVSLILILTITLLTVCINCRRQSDIQMDPIDGAQIEAQEETKDAEKSNSKNNKGAHLATVHTLPSWRDHKNMPESTLPSTLARSRTLPSTPAHSRTPPLDSAHSRTPPLDSAYSQTPPLDSAHSRTPPWTPPTAGYPLGLRPQLDTPLGLRPQPDTPLGLRPQPDTPLGLRPQPDVHNRAELAY